jgi:hypothetical protein
MSTQTHDRSGVIAVTPRDEAMPAIAKRCVDWGTVVSAVITKRAYPAH